MCICDSYCKNLRENRFLTLQLVEEIKNDEEVVLSVEGSESDRFQKRFKPVLGFT